MEFTKSETSCGTSFGLYRLDHNYVSDLRKNEKLIIDPDINDLYCGPVYHGTCDRGAFGFFAPVDKTFFENNDCFLMAFFEGVYANFIDFTKMIPVVHSRYLTPFTDNNKLIRFCIKSQTDLEICGDAAIMAYKNKQPYPFLNF